MPPRKVGEAVVAEAEGFKLLRSSKSLSGHASAPESDLLLRLVVDAPPPAPGTPT
jgi:hypothetical protein